MYINSKNHQSFFLKFDEETMAENQKANIKVDCMMLRDNFLFDYYYLQTSINKIAKN